MGERVNAETLKFAYCDAHYQLIYHILLTLLHNRDWSLNINMYLDDDIVFSSFTFVIYHKEVKYAHFWRHAM